jgi:hypothetical protein
MGDVYEARHDASGQLVAVKLISADVDSSPEAVERFRQEGRLASTITHPRCVFVMTVDEEAGRPYIVMELMPGRTLDDLVKQGGPLPVAEALGKIFDVLEGLQEAHRLGVVHRDVKPSNCFLDAEGRVKVGDFGLAKSLLADANLTRTGAFLGTPLYTSPEQVKREPVDPQSDLYSLAASLYYLLAGKAPFQSGDPLATLARIVSDDPPPLRSVRPDMPAALDRVILRGLERDRRRRWRTLEEFRAALQPFVPGRLSVGGLGVRVIANVFDATFLWILCDAFGRLAWGSGAADPNAASFAEEFRKDLIYYAPLVIAYYGFMEGVFGWSLGKWLLRLRVHDLVHGAPPGLWRGLLRSAVFDLTPRLFIWLFLLALTVWGGGFSGDSAEDDMAVNLASLLGTILGLAVLLIPMRKRNGYRGLHEFASGTRVVELPWPRRRRPFERPPFDLARSQPEGMPGRVGPYVVRGALRWRGSDRTLLADEPVLGRSVWVELRPAGKSPPKARRDIGRSARLRWLSGGAEGEWEWDAFLAPTGSPLPTLVAGQGPLPWPDARPVLEQLAEELDASTREGSLPQSLSPDQVWLDVHGRVLLLEASPTGSTADDLPGSVEDTAPRRALRLLREVAVLMLEGARRSPGDNSPVAAPVPGAARAILDRLATGGQPFEGIRPVCDELRAAAEMPDEVTRWHRFQHLEVQATLLVLPCLLMYFIALLGPSWDAYQEASAARDQGDRLATQLDGVMYAEFVGMAVAPSMAPGPLAAFARLDEDLRLRRKVGNYLAEAEVFRRRLAMPPFWGGYCLALSNRWEDPDPPARPPDRQAVRSSALKYADADVLSKFELRRDAALWVLSVMILIWPAAWICWAFLTRGGWSWRATRLALVRRNGRPATRWECAWRALLVWLPVALLLLLAAWGQVTLFGEWLRARESPPWGMTWLTLATQALSVAVLPVYFALALWQPTRALHDRLAGTYLVPR